MTRYSHADRISVYLLTVIVVTVLVWSTPYAQVSGASDTIEGRQLILRDSSGRARMIAAVVDSGPGTASVTQLTMIASNGTPALALKADASGSRITVGDGVTGVRIDVIKGASTVTIVDSAGPSGQSDGLLLSSGAGAAGLFDIRATMSQTAEIAQSPVLGRARQLQSTTRRGPSIQMFRNGRVSSIVQ